MSNKTFDFFAVLAVLALAADALAVVFLTGAFLAAVVFFTVFAVTTVFLTVLVLLPAAPADAFLTVLVPAVAFWVKVLIPTDAVFFVFAVLTASFLLVSFLLFTVVVSLVYKSTKLTNYV